MQWIVKALIFAIYIPFHLLFLILSLIGKSKKTFQEKYPNVDAGIAIVLWIFFAWWTYNSDWEALPWVYKKDAIVKSANTFVVNPLTGFKEGMLPTPAFKDTILLCLSLNNQVIPKDGFCISKAAYVYGEDSCYIKGRVHQEQILITTDFWSSDGERIGTIVDNKISLNQNCKVFTNKSPLAIEVYDNHGNVVFQLSHIKRKDMFFIHGIFHDGKEYVKHYKNQKSSNSNAFGSNYSISNVPISRIFNKKGVFISNSGALDYLNIRPSQKELDLMFPNGFPEGKKVYLFETPHVIQK